MRRKHQLVGSLVHAPGNAHAHALDQPPAKRGLQGRRRLGDGGDRSPGVGFRGGVRGEEQGLAAQEFAIDIDDAEVGLGRPQVDGQRDVLVVEGDKSGAASARQAAQRSRRHPAFFDQLADDQRDGAGLQPGQARQVRAAYRLAHVDGLQDDIPVDGAGRLAGCDSAIWPGWLGVHVRLEVRITQVPTAGTGCSKAGWGLQAKCNTASIRCGRVAGRAEMEKTATPLYFPAIRRILVKRASLSA